eukprot:991885-Amphidinium_carterae.2
METSFLLLWRSGPMLPIRRLSCMKLYSLTPNQAFWGHGFHQAQCAECGRDRYPKKDKGLRRPRQEIMRVMTPCYWGYAGRALVASPSPFDALSYLAKQIYN